MSQTVKKILIPGILGITALILLRACSPKIPKGAKAIQDFNPERFLGTWYEVARLDYKWERNLDNVNATYSLKPDGSIKVDNKGFDYTENKWKGKIGEARFVHSSTEARLKVSFFKPFWAGYNVVDIDEEYKYALVFGNDLCYMWILSKEKAIPEKYKERFLKKAQETGYDTSKLIWVKQDK